MLECKAADRWEWLYEFLGTVLREGKYPHRNDGRAANQIMTSFAFCGVGIWMAVGICGWGIVWGIRQILNNWN